MNKINFYNKLYGNKEYVEDKKINTEVKTIDNKIKYKETLDTDFKNSSPLSVKETIIAIIEKKLVNNYYITSSTINYKANSTKFKINQIGTTEYDNSNGIEIDHNEKRMLLFNKHKYNEPISKEEILIHPGWLAIVENDKSLLEEYCNLVFENNIKQMEFWIKTKVTKEEYNYIGIVNLNNKSYIDTFYDINKKVNIISKK